MRYIASGLISALALTAAHAAEVPAQSEMTAPVTPAAPATPTATPGPEAAQPVPPLSPQAVVPVDPATPVAMTAPAVPALSGEQALVNAEGYLNNTISYLSQNNFSGAESEITKIEAVLDPIEKGSLSEGERRIRLRSNIKAMKERLEKLRTAVQNNDVPACRYEISRTKELMTMIRRYTR